MLSKLFYYFIIFAGLFLFTGCFLVDPMHMQPKTGSIKMKGTVKDITYHKSPGSNYYVVQINSKDKLAFKEHDPVTETALSQIEKNDYIDYSINYDKKIIIFEITKKSEEKCVINITSEFNEDFNQKITKAKYLEKYKNGVNICEKYSLKKSKNIINISGQTEYLE